MAEIIGRLFEKKELQKALDSAKSELVAVIGRRRVGKTFLIDNFLSTHIKLEVIGVQNVTLEVQILHFMTAMKTAKLIATIDKLPQSWLEAFALLQDCLQSNPSPEKTVLFFDELPWLASGKTDFIAAFDYFWNAWCSKQNMMVEITEQ